MGYLESFWLLPSHDLTTYYFYFTDQGGGGEIVEDVPTFNLLPRGIVKIYLLVEGVAIAAMGHCF